MPHDRFYGLAAEEIARKDVDSDLMARAYALALGDAEKTRAIYISIRAERLEEIAKQMLEAQARMEAEERRNRELRDREEAKQQKERERKEKKERVAQEAKVEELRRNSERNKVTGVGRTSPTDGWERAFATRFDYTRALKARFGFLSLAKIPTSEGGHEAFEGDKSRLVAPAKLDDVAEAVGLLRFALIDAVKAGLIDGVYEPGGDWWVALNASGVPRTPISSKVSSNTIEKSSAKPLANDSDVASAVKAMQEALKASRFQ